MTDQYEQHVIAGDWTEPEMTVAELKGQLCVNPNHRAGWWSDWCFVELDDNKLIGAVTRCADRARWR